MSKKFIRNLFVSTALTLIVESSAYSQLSLLSASNDTAGYPFTPLHLFYMSPSGSDGASGTSPATAWKTPNHAVSCGDVIIAASGTYSSGTPFSTGDWGVVSNCPSTTGGIDGTGGVYTATVLCAGSDVESCTITSINAGGRAASIDRSNWAMEGFNGSGSFGATCHSGSPCSGTSNGHTTIGYVAFINDITRNSSQGIFSTDEGASGTATGGVDEFAIVGSIAYNSSTDSLPVSCIDAAGPSQLDSLAGTHIYFAGNFAWHCQAVSPLTSDEQGYIFDTFEVHNYNGTGVILNNIGFDNGGPCIQMFNQNLGTKPNQANEYVINNTCYSNLQQQLSGYNGAGAAGGINTQANGSSGILRYTVYNNIISETETHVGGSAGFHTAYAMVANAGANYVPVIGGTSLNNVFSGAAASCNHSCDSGDNVDAENGTWASTYNSNNTYENPSFQNTTDLINNWFNTVPNCTGYRTTVACMGWNGTSAGTGTIIYDLTPTAANTAGKGYQVPGPCTPSVYYPTWLKGIVRLQWNAANSTIREMPDLITKPCGM